MHTPEQAVLAADAERRSALLAADRTRLARLLADEFRYVHASGKVEFRQAYLDSVASGSSRFLSMDVSDTFVTLYGEVAVMGGKVQLARTEAGEVLSKAHQFTAVWVKTSGAWTLASFQNSSRSTT